MQNKHHFFLYILVKFCAQTKWKIQKNFVFDGTIFRKTWTRLLEGSEMAGSLQMWPWLVRMVHWSRRTGSSCLPQVRFSWRFCREIGNAHIHSSERRAAELEAMVDFLYFGEASVEQESLETFLGLAVKLKLEGLTSSLTEANRNELRGKEAAL